MSYTLVEKTRANPYRRGQRILERISVPELKLEFFRHDLYGREIEVYHEAGHVVTLSMINATPAYFRRVVTEFLDSYVADCGIE